jgi:hypothetical protein
MTPLTVGTMILISTCMLWRTKRELLCEIVEALHLREVNYVRDVVVDVGVRETPTLDRRLDGAAITLHHERPIEADWPLHNDAVCNMQWPMNGADASGEPCGFVLVKISGKCLVSRRKA